MISTGLQELEATLPGSPQHVPQCRFCLEESPVEELITPCKCEGTSRYVHESCLRRWQGEALCYEHALVCQVCRSHFSLKPVEKLWRSSKSRSSEETTAALFDNVRTNPRYDRDAITRLPRSLRSRLRPLLDSGCLVLQTPQRARDESLARRGRQHNDNVMIFFEAVLASRMAHWHKGIYLLAAKWERQGTDGSDALVGVNLGGAPVSDPRGNELALLQEHLGPTTPFQFLVGGPVGPEKLLALVPFEGELSHPLQRLVHIVEGGSTKALFGELRDVVQVLAREENLSPQSATVFQGHAVWSSDQLMSEVARGSWGLARAFDEDFKVLPDRDAEAKWEAIWHERTVLQREGSEAPLHRERRNAEEAEGRPTPRPTPSGSGCIGLGVCTIT